MLDRENLLFRITLGKFYNRFSYGGFFFVKKSFRFIFLCLNSFFLCNQSRKDKNIIMTLHKCKFKA